MLGPYGTKQESWRDLNIFLSLFFHHLCMQKIEWMEKKIHL